MLQVLLQTHTHTQSNLFNLQLSNWLALSIRGLRIAYFWPMRMSNWRHIGVCSSFQQRQTLPMLSTQHTARIPLPLPHATQPILLPPTSAPSWMRGNYVTDLVGLRTPSAPCHELRNLCETDNEQRRCQSLPLSVPSSSRQDAPIEHAAQPARATLVSQARVA